MNEEQLKYWNDYLDSINQSNRDLYVEASIAGDLNLADELLNLYLDGKKTAGSSLVKDFVLAEDELPKVGNHWIVLDKNEKPCCILKTVKVEVNRFVDVTQEIAIAEGEGDLSVEHWRKIHKDFFTPYLSEWGITDLDNEDVITEFYEIVFK
jgi:5-formyltetrahydrofolate cyclo-ligase